MDATAIGMRLKSLREAKGKTIAEMSADIGLAPATISMYENGNRIATDENKILIARYFKKSVNSIFFT